MFTKNDIQQMMKDNEGKTFVIKTNTANGHGINGVSYDTHISFCVNTERGNMSYERHFKVTTLDVKDFSDGMLVLGKTVKTFTRNTYNDRLRIDYERTSRTTIYIPYETIQTIEFIENDSEFYGNNFRPCSFIKNDDYVNEL